MNEFKRIGSFFSTRRDAEYCNTMQILKRLGVFASAFSEEENRGVKSGIGQICFFYYNLRTFFFIIYY